VDNGMPWTTFEHLVSGLSSASAWWMWIRTRPAPKLEGADIDAYFATKFATKF